MYRLLFLLPFLIACHAFPVPVKTKPAYIPHAVYNSCTGKWCVRTGFVRRYDSHHEPIALFANMGTYWIDTIAIYLGSDTEMIDNKPYITTDINFPEGSESIFDDSLSATVAYNNCVEKKRLSAYLDSLYKVGEQIEKHRVDSLWKCQHTYQ